MQNSQVKSCQIMVKASKFTTFLLATLASFSFAETLNAQTTTTATLSVVVKGLRNQIGQVCLSVYNNTPGFPVNPQGIVQRRCVSKTGNSVTVRFTGLKLGTYAVTAIDDENKDFQLNQNALGIPTEGVAISINPTAPPLMGPPAFKDLSFPVQKTTTKTINVTYL